MPSAGENRGLAIFGASSTRAHLVAIGACLTLFYVVMVVPVTGAVLNVYGDAGDARFNHYILEHVYRWLRGDDVSLFSPGFFYPYPDVLFFSVNHLLTVVFYAPWRFLGVSEADAFMLWIYGGYVSCLATAYYVGWRLALPAAAAAVLAIAFALTLPSLVRIGHAQVIFRFGVPLALYFAWLGIRDRNVFALAGAALAFALQLLADIYIGVFLALMLAPLVLFTAIRDRTGLVGGLAAGLRAAWRTRRGSLLMVGGLAVIAALLAVANFAAYAGVARAYNAGRPWDMIAGNLPRPGSYLVLDRLPYWRDLRLPVDAGPRRHAMFVGLGVSLLFLAGLVALAIRRAARPAARFGEALLVALAVCAAMSLLVGSFTLWAFIAAIPGLSAIRVVNRIILVMAFPIAVVAAIGFRFFAESVRPQIVGAALASGLCSLAVYEIQALRKPVYSWEENDVRVEAYAEAARNAGKAIDRPILFLWPDTSMSIVTNGLDAMWASLKLGWPTLNGYSGLRPYGANRIYHCRAPQRRYDAYAEWAGVPAETVTPDLVARTVTIYAASANRPNLPSEEGASKVSLSVRGTAVRDGAMVAADLLIRNDWGEPLPRGTSAPVRIAWRFVSPDKAPGTDEGWQGFLPLARNVPPCRSLAMPVSIRLPEAAGTYRLQVTLQSEGRFFLHDKGMAILTLPDAVVVAAASPAQNSAGDAP